MFDEEDVEKQIAGGIKTLSSEQFRTDSEKTSERMRKVKSKGTNLEHAMELILREIRVPYVSQPKILGHPDFELTGYGVLIFCDSSFWHGRNPDDLSGKNFGRNRELWVKKLNRTRERDREVNCKLAEDGWKVLRFWDDEILKTPDQCKKRILEELSDP